MTTPLLSFYGDDFTGSTDVMEVLALHGIETVLFLAAPTPEERAAFPQARAVGMAGTSRTWSPAQMQDRLPEAFRALGAMGAPYCHYKVCSTFDSNPTVGSIGAAIGIGRATLGTGITPLIVGAPRLRRYVAFANLFATVGAETFRLDRHPTMSRHPVTPMTEGDLRLHLGAQTDLPVHSCDVLALEADGPLPWPEGNGILLFDTLNQAHLRRIGEAVWARRQETSPFIAGSSGVEYALCAHWCETGEAARVESFADAGEVEALPVFSGSASPVTAGQIAWARANGWTTIAVDAPALLDPATADRALPEAADKAVACLRKGGSPLLHLAEGPDDPAITATRETAQRLGLAQTGARLAAATGKLARLILSAHPVPRLCVAGGDTSGLVAQALDINALTAIRPLDPGGPLCRAHAPGSPFDGLQISLKGGQIGRPNYFGSVKAGRSLPV